MTDQSITYLEKTKQHIAALESRQSKTDGVLGSLAIASALVAIAERLAPLEAPDITPNLVIPACKDCDGSGKLYNDGSVAPRMCIMCEGSGFGDDPDEAIISSALCECHRHQSFDAWHTHLECTRHPTYQLLDDKHVTAKAGTITRRSEKSSQNTQSSRNA